MDTFSCVRRRDCYRDTYIVAVGDCLTSFGAGFVIFTIIGYMAHEMNVGIDKVATEGQWWPRGWGRGSTNSESVGLLMVYLASSLINSQACSLQPAVL